MLCCRVSGGGAAAVAAGGGEWGAGSSGSGEAVVAAFLLPRAFEPWWTARAFLAVEAGRSSAKSCKHASVFRVQVQVKGCRIWGNL